MRNNIPEEDPPLQPLRVSEGWTMDYNNGLYELDVAPGVVADNSSWRVFKEDMLQMSHAGKNRIIDIGFYPEGDLEEGEYGMVMHEGDFTGKLIAELHTRDRALLVSTIERWMRKVSSGEM